MPDLHCSFAVLGTTGNPWADMHILLHAQILIIVSFAYLAVTVRDVRRKGRDIWVIKVVERPAGRYLALNQYLFYPSLTVALSAVWIAYDAYVYGMFGPAQGNPRSLFYWLTLCWLPFFALLAATTYSITSAANLASRGRQPHSHRLGPFTSAAMFTVLFPVLLGLVLAVGIWTGSRWHRFASRWEEAYQFLGQQAAAYTGGAPDPARVQQADAMLGARCATAMKAKDALLTNSIVYIVAAAVLVALNLFSGIYLLSTLRYIVDRQLIVPRGTALVAPLQPLRSSTPNGADATLADVNEVGQPIAAWEAAAEAEVTKLKMHRLRWDVTLFFMSVVPSCLAFIGYTAWLGTQMIAIMSDPRKYEFATLGMIWIYAFVSLVCLSALTVKTFLSLRLAARRRLEPVAPVTESQSQRRYRPTEQVRPHDWAEEHEEYGVGGEKEDWPRGGYSWDEKRGGERPPLE
ncbi:proteophosphoglycan ppg4 [Rhodotorula toruloides]|uniref:Proteophosphoglycan ppg4 n=1 Tax=Rhodotorula toruloides TaxID=5286 RepID=A0A511KEI9_RHOTO|nr:proteophosphoglycan ppg4 [Rhodotorula toruloides]